ncbi:MAG: phosphatase PAP2 family protein [Nitrososphaerota archaeon]|nr:phosphatase PAP2 family protein [Nitrososphaerota archaeon]
MSFRKEIIRTYLASLIPSIVLFGAVLVIGDEELFLLINLGMINPILDFICVYVSPVAFCLFYVLALMSLIFSSRKSSRLTATLSIINGAVSYLVGSTIKNFIQRPRPEIVVNGRVMYEARLIGFWHSSPFSLPSTTAALAFGLTLPILIEKRSCGLLLTALCYLISFSVVYTGFHFPLDIVAATFLSLAITACISLAKNLLNPLLPSKKDSADNHM